MDDDSVMFLNYEIKDLAQMDTDIKFDTFAQFCKAYGFSDLLGRVIDYSTDHDKLYKLTNCIFWIFNNPIDSTKDLTPDIAFANSIAEEMRKNLMDKWFGKLPEGETVECL